MFWWFLHGLHNFCFTGSHQSQCRFYCPWIRAELHHCRALWKMPPHISKETTWKFVSWPRKTLLLCLRKLKFCPMALKDLTCLVLHHCSVFRKEKRLKEWKKSCSEHLAMIICCNLWVLSADYCDLTQWNGRGFCILFFVCVIPMSCESFLGT